MEVSLVFTPGEVNKCSQLLGQVNINDKFSSHLDKKYGMGGKILFFISYKVFANLILDIRNIHL